MMSSIILTVVISALFAALFCAMETAAHFSNKLKLETQKKKNPLLGHVANIFCRHPRQYVTTILIGNSTSLTLYALQMSLLIGLVTGAGSEAPVKAGMFLLQSAVSALIFILVARFIPRAVVRIDPNLFYKILALPAYIFYILFFPLAWVVSLISGHTPGHQGASPDADHETGYDKFDNEEIAQMLDQVTESEADDQNDNNIRLFRNAIDFSGLLVRDCMVPRVDIEAIDKERTIEELTKLFIETQFSRIPVYENNIDNIIGYVNSKSLYRDPQSITEILKEIDYVPETMPAQRLLSNFIKKHSIAVVIDEFGGTAGMITIEDILEEIFGEIEDEHDLQNLVEKKISDREYIFSGRLEIEYINEKYQLGFPESDDYDTLAGYVIFQHQNIPSAGEIITDGNKQIKILRADALKVELIRLTVTAVD